MDTVRPPDALTFMEAFDTWAVAEIGRVLLSTSQLLDENDVKILLDTIRDHGYSRLEKRFDRYFHPNLFRVFF